MGRRTEIAPDSDDDKERGLYTIHENSSVKDAEPDLTTAPRNDWFRLTMEVFVDREDELLNVEHIPEDKRDSTSSWYSVLMWWSINLGLTSMPIGFLSRSTFSLTFTHAVAAILGFNGFGALMTALVTVLGPKTGLRATTITRFSSGYVGGTVYAILNILSLLGWSVICVILGGQVLVSVNKGAIPAILAVILLGICSVIPCFIGRDTMHKYQRYGQYGCLPLLIVMLCLWGLGARLGFDLKQKDFVEVGGRTRAANILRYGGVLFAGVTRWAPAAADYSRQMPVTIQPLKVFIQTFLGIYIPTCFVEILGAALITIKVPDSAPLSTQDNAGSVLSQLLSRWHGGGKLLLAILALSVMYFVLFFFQATFSSRYSASNMVNTFSIGRSIQGLGKPFARVPLIYLTLLASFAYTAAGVVGRGHFYDILSNFLSILGYWTAFFMVMLLEEHFLFRSQNGLLQGYNIDDWDSPSKLPLGIAGVIAGCFGAAGAVVGMSQTWYTGPLSKIFGNNFGVDIGFELATAFAAISYPPMRWLEIRYTGR